ncbi:hypothetical protein BKP64_05505 [Marinobacter salinus]|uniref:Uncharacterized protein n=1 Tax=Marinobacter salinus TaxID=1874317 RepID=A0A1D9GJU9_9GAMM|nr:hypothetical protein [Marinobacter salinus]AOY87670.1 hypothetical protein BKP64_05505 [Marinobacter salinus]
MLRPFLVVGLILGLLSLSVFGPRLLSTIENGAEQPEKRDCNLLAGPCEWTIGPDQWRAELTVLGDSGQGIEYRLTITATGAPERLLAVLRGESMYMGEYPVPLARETGRVFTARFTAPICSTGSDMIWRIDLQQGQTPIEGVPVNLVFQAQSL